MRTLTLEQEALVLFYLENHRGTQMKGETRKIMYEVYQIFSKDGRTVSTCSCMDADTHRKVDNFINDIEWSEETKTSPKMKQVLPDRYVEPIEIEEEDTQPVSVDVKKLQRALSKKKPSTKRKRTTKTKK